MKTTLLINDGFTQLVITPESDFEKTSLSLFSSKDVDITIKQGSFYDCYGGWVRYGSDESLILKTANEYKKTT